MAEWEVALIALPFLALGILVGCFLSSLLDAAVAKAKAVRRGEGL